MGNFSFSDNNPNRCKSFLFLLAFSWLAGLVLGALLPAAGGEGLPVLLRGIPGAPVSLTGLLLLRLLPFLLSAGALLLGQAWFLIPVAFGKAFLFSFLSAGILGVFGDAGWLVRYLLTFGDMLSLPLLWLLWVYCLDDSALMPRIGLLMLLTAALCCFDYFCVLPFGAGLLS